MDYDSFVATKKQAAAGDARVAYVDEGSGPPLLLLHGCPFSSFVWRKVIPTLATAHRCLAPDLLGLCNAEAYDNWPSADERPFVKVTQLPGIGAAVMRVYGTRWVLPLVLGLAKAVKNRAVLDDELVDGYRRANLGDAHRRAKTARFLAGQVDPANNAWTGLIVGGLRSFDKPTLLLWGADDPHFGPRWAERLAADMPGVVGVELLADTGHLLMEERPVEVATAILEFLAHPPADHRSSPSVSPDDRTRIRP